MKIKFVNIPYCLEQPMASEVLAPVVAPSNLVLLSSMLRAKGYQVDQDDLNIKLHYSNYYFKANIDINIFYDLNRIMAFLQGKGDKKLLKILEKIINFTNWDNFEVFLFTAHIPQNFTGALCLFSLTSVLKKRYPDIPFIAGGRFTRFVDLELFSFLRREGILDFIIKGPGEVALPKLLDLINRKDFKENSFKQIKGLFYEWEGRCYFNEGHYSTQLPVRPDFTGLPMHMYKRTCNHKFSKGLIKQDMDILILPYKFTNGCPYRCAFCSMPKLDKFEFKAIDEVIKDLDILIKTYNTNYIFFLDDTFNFSLNYTKQLCLAILDKKLNIKWSACVHPNNLDFEAIDLMKKAGAVRLIYGFETASPKLQRYVGKNIDILKLSKIIRYAHNKGVWNGIEIICGLPYEDNQDIILTKKFIFENKEYIDEYYINTFVLHYFSPFREEPSRYDLSIIKEMNFFNFYNRPLEYPAKNRTIGYIFEENNGLKWEEKKNQIVKSYLTMMSSIKYQMLPVTDILPYLFYFFHFLKDKNEVRILYRNIAPLIMRKAFFRSSRFLKMEIERLLKVKDISYLCRGVKRLLGR